MFEPCCVLVGQRLSFNVCGNTCALDSIPSSFVFFYFIHCCFVLIYNLFYSQYIQKALTIVTMDTVGTYGNLSGVTFCQSLCDSYPGNC